MKLQETLIPGLFEVQAFVADDSRGSFVKFFSASLFERQGLETNFVESYYSVSKKGVIRGMHFQLPPHQHAKLIYVPHGIVQDVVLDMRKNSPTFGQYQSFELSVENKKAVYIPVGLAHGFESLADDAVITYLQTSPYSAQHDAGIAYNSFGMDWKSLAPILSDRDRNFPTFKEFKTPFVFTPGVNPKEQT